MRILAVSDRVVENLYSSHVKQAYKAVDLLIGCGDLPYYYLDFLVSAFDTPMVYVLGNHDHGPQYAVDKRVLTGVHGGENIHGRLVQCQGLFIAGLEGSMRYRPRATLMYNENEMRQELLQLLPSLLWNRLRHGRFLDILVTHSPPFGIHDKNDLAHTGFKLFLLFMRLFKPRYLLHGHVHLYRQNIPRETVYEATTVINVYPYRFIEWSESKINSRSEVVD